jgi:lycopene cyclase domain-containing protein
LNSHYTYFLILAASLVGPLALSFDKKVGFYKSWRYAFPAIIIPASLFVIWDMYFTVKGVWSFNEAYFSGIKLYNLPLEEVLFFFVVPYCSIFVYACIRAYFPNLTNKKNADLILKGLAVSLFITGIIYYNRYYTGGFILIIYLLRNFFKGFDAVSFLVSYIICLIPFLIVNGFLTAIPVVLYNDTENLGIRIYTIPFEDVFYGMLLILMNIVIYEKLKTHNPEPKTQNT